MKLISLKLKNFRCYCQETQFQIDDLVAIIGRNDVGKSAILDALDAFFNKSIEQGDLSSNAESDQVEITCIFSSVPSEMVLDTAEATDPEEEGICNGDGNLEIKKVFKFGGRASGFTYLSAKHPSDPRLENILSLKNTALKQKADELGVDLDGVNKRKNPPIRKAIRDFVGGGTSLTELKVEGSVDGEDNLKTVWGALRKHLPIYTLFKSDKTFDDKDNDIKNPLQSSIKEALALPDILPLLQQIEDKVKEYSTNIADRTIEKLKNFDESLSERLKSEFNKAPGYEKIFDLTLLNENNIPLNKRGSGIRRLVVLSFFQAQAERRKVEDGAPGIIYAIEEPETSQHPNHQMMIISSLCELSEQENVQVLFTTHSANLVREIPVDALRFLSEDDDSRIQIENGFDLASQSTDEAVIQKIVETLGILPNPADRIKVLLYVEGNHDVNALKRYSRIIHQEDPAVINLEETDCVGYVITGGSALKHYIEQKHLSGLGKPEIHIYDNDVAEYRTAVRRINDEENPRKIAFNTTKRELENYLHIDAIRTGYEENGSPDVLVPAIEQDTDVPFEVARVLNSLVNNNWDELEQEKRKELASAKKKFLNTIAVDKMTCDYLRDNGDYDELHGWLATIKQLSLAG